jgi:hypothetical protein
VPLDRLQPSLGNMRKIAAGTGRRLVSDRIQQRAYLATGPSPPRSRTWSP